MYPELPSVYVEMTFLQYFTVRFLSHNPSSINVSRDSKREYTREAQGICPVVQSLIKLILD